MEGRQVEILPLLSDIVMTFEYLAECDIFSYFVKMDSDPFTDFGIGHNDDVTSVDFGDPITLVT